MRTTNLQLTLLCVPLRTPNQIYSNCVSKLLHFGLTAWLWNVDWFHCALSCTKGKPPLCWLSNTGPALKMEIKWQSGKGGGEGPPVSDSCLDWQKWTCQSGKFSVFSLCSTAPTSPAACPEVCLGSVHIHSARNKICSHRLLKIDQNCITRGFFFTFLYILKAHIYLITFHLIKNQRELLPLEHNLVI